MRGFQTYFFETKDNGETCSKPVMTSSAYSNSSVRRGITLFSGELLFPIYFPLGHDKFIRDGKKDRLNIKPFGAGHSANTSLPIYLTAPARSHFSSSAIPSA